MVKNFLRPLLRMISLNHIIHNKFLMLLQYSCTKKEIHFKELLRQFCQEERQLLEDLTISIHGSEIHTAASKTRNGGKRYWFECPGCKKRRWILLYNKALKKVGCRECLSLPSPCPSKDSILSKFITYCKKLTS